jgi:hypothetical protein
MSKADIISKRHKDAIYPAAAYFFNQTSGIIDIQNGRTPPCIMGAKEFVDKAYVALKEDGQDVRHMDDLKTISSIMYQAFLGSAADEHKPYGNPP